MCRESIEALWKTCKYHLKDKMGILTPLKLRFAVTKACNSQCITCNVWKVYKENSSLIKDELTLPEIEKFFLRNKKFLQKVRSVAITGGEPTLRKDLVEIIKIIDSNIPNHSININTNGLLTDRILCAAEEILGFRKKIFFLLSLDGFEENHDKVRGIKGAHEKTMKTLKELENMREKFPNLKLGINFTLTPFNFKDYSKLYEFSRAHNLEFNEIIPSTGELYEKKENPLRLGKNQREEIIKVMRTLQNKSFSIEREIKILLLNGKGRDFDCWAGRLILLIEANGDVYPNGGCPKEWSMGNLRDFDYSLKELHNSSHARDILHMTQRCRKCVIFCEAGLTLKTAEYFYSFLRAKKEIKKATHSYL